MIMNIGKTIALLLATVVLLSDFAFANTNGDITNSAISKIYADIL